MPRSYHRRLSRDLNKNRHLTEQKKSNQLINSTRTRQMLGAPRMTLDSTTVDFSFDKLIAWFLLNPALTSRTQYRIVGGRALALHLPNAEIQTEDWDIDVHPSSEAWIKQFLAYLSTYTPIDLVPKIVQAAKTYRFCVENKTTAVDQKTRWQTCVVDFCLRTKKEWSRNERVDIGGFQVATLQDLKRDLQRMVTTREKQWKKGGETVSMLLEREARYYKNLLRLQLLNSCVDGDSPKQNQEARARGKSRRSRPIPRTKPEPESESKPKPRRCFGA